MPPISLAERPSRTPPRLTRAWRPDASWARPRCCAQLRPRDEAAQTTRKPRWWKSLRRREPCGALGGRAERAIRERAHVPGALPPHNRSAPIRFRCALAASACDENAMHPGFAMGAMSALCSPELLKSLHPPHPELPARSQAVPCSTVQSVARRAPTGTQRSPRQ